MIIDTTITTEQPQEVPINNIIDEHPEQQEEPINNIIDEQPEQQPEPSEPQNNDTTLDIAHKTKILSKCHVIQLRVCYKNQIIKVYKNKLITFDETQLKIKQIQHNEKKEDNSSYLWKIINERS